MINLFYDETQKIQLRKRLRIPAEIMLIQDINENWTPLSNITGRATAELNNREFPFSIAIDNCLFDTGNESGFAILSYGYFSSFHQELGFDIENYEDSNITHTLEGTVRAKKSLSLYNFKMKDVEFCSKLLFSEEIASRSRSTVIFGINVFLQLITSIVSINNEKLNLYVKNKN
jgi:hypothetical protein